MVPRRPGQFLDERIRRVVVRGFVILGIGIPFAILGFFWWPLSIVSLIPFTYLWFNQRTGRSLDWSNDEKGLQGEVTVARVLELQAPEVLAVHDFELRWGNVDHVAIAPTGVFAIETKNWQGDFSLSRGRLVHNGWRQEGVRTQVVSGACRVHDVLLTDGINLFVKGVLVSTNARVAKGGFEVHPIKVVGIDDLAELLLRGRRQLSPHEQIRIQASLLRNGAPVRVSNISWD
jgi:hypothetical protein